MRKVSIIIPSYNEEKRIGRTMKSYLDYFNSLKKQRILDFELIIVINNTKDNSRKIIYNFKDESLKVLDFEKRGKGFAVIEGFKEALKGNSELIGFVDADMSTTPESFYDLVEKIGGAGGAIAGRYSKGAKVYPKQSLARIISSRMYNSVIRALLLIPYRDTQCGAKLFSREALKSTINEMGMTKWAFDVELIYKIRKKGYKIKEIPTKWSNQDYSTINFMKSGPWMVLGIIRLRLLNSPFKFLVRLYDKIMERIRRFL